MNKHYSLFIFVFLSLLLFPNNFGTNIIINSEVNINETNFNYIIGFSQNDSYSSISFEKPKDSIITSAYDENNYSLFYSKAGDFYIFKIGNSKGKKFYINFKSNLISEELKKTNSFKNYVNFNFPVDNLTFKLILENDFGLISDVFPRDYSIVGNKEVIWNLKNLQKDTLFLVNFDKTNNNLNIENGTTNNSNQDIFKYYNFIKSNFIYIMWLFLIIIFIFIIYFYRSLLKSLVKFNIEFSKNNKLKKEKDNIQLNIDESENISLNKNENLEPIETETFEDFLKKYLTENEKEVVRIIFENEGIIQSEILNLIENMKKSNLSKIITKLDGKHILKRIRVGKVSKIYLGDKLNKFKEE